MFKVKDIPDQCRDQTIGIKEIFWNKFTMIFV